MAPVLLWEKRMKRSHRGKTRKIRVSNALFDEAISKIAPYSTALILDSDLAGSGTLIKWGNEHGVLTAHHVPHNPEDPHRRFDFGSLSQRLCFTVQERASCFGLPMGGIRCIDVGIPQKAHAGPDVSVLVLPRIGIGTLKAKKEFFNIEFDASTKLETALRNDGFFVVMGNPGIEVMLQDRPKEIAGFEEVLFTPALSICSQPVKRYRQGRFDFMEFSVGPKEEDGTIANFRGISGGGVWRVPLIVTGDPANQKVRIGEPILAGIAFWQTRRQKGKRRIRCHGARTVYSCVLKKLLA